MKEYRRLKEEAAKRMTQLSEEYDSISSVDTSHKEFMELELNEKQSSAQALEREVSEGRKRCAELKEELDQVNKDIGDARVSDLDRRRTNSMRSFLLVGSKRV
jgi:peptidoglycan hydrolase CwlO-like protein